MTIDAHTHLLFPSRAHYPWLGDDAPATLRRDFEIDELEFELRQHGMERAVLVQTRSSLAETETFLDIAAAHSSIAGVVGWVDLTAPDIETTLDRLLAAPRGQSLVGIRHQVQDEPDPDWLLRADVQRGLRVLERRNLSFDVLVQAPQRAAAVEMARRQPDLTCVLDHAGNPDISLGEWDSWRAALEPLVTLPNVVVKLSGLLTRALPGAPEENVVGYLRWCLEHFGPARCMFGSDWPVCLLASSYSQVIDPVARMLEPCSPETRALVLGGAARQAYRLR